MKKEKSREHEVSTIKISPEVVAALRTAVETAVGRSLATPRDFDWLRLQIHNRLDALISLSTLKRVWGYVEAKNTPSRHTLNTLARLCGYKDLEDFLAADDATDKPTPSSPLAGRTINVPTELRVGDEVELYWEPGRVCHVKYNGSLHFEVTYSEKTRLKPGDTFLASLFVKGAPLYIELHKSENTSIMPYVCGQRGGITFRKVEKETEEEEVES